MVQKMKKIILLLIFLTLISRAFAQDIRQDRAMSHYNKGNEFSGNSEYALAIKEYSETINLMPDYYRAYFQRANAYYLSGNYGKAVEDYDKAIKLSPDYADAFYNRGIALSKQGNVKKAAEDWEETLRITPNHAPARQALNITGTLRFAEASPGQTASSVPVNETPGNVPGYVLPPVRQNTFSSVQPPARQNSAPSVQQGYVPARQAQNNTGGLLEETPGHTASSFPVNETKTPWIEYTRTREYLRIAGLLSDELLQSILSSVKKAPHVEPDYAPERQNPAFLTETYYYNSVPQDPAPEFAPDYYNPVRQNRVPHTVEPETAPAPAPALAPAPAYSQSRNNITIYNHPDNNDTTRMELDIPPDFDFKIITDFSNRP